MTEHKPQKNQVQCADCWQWVDADKPHTCKPQIRRNKRAAK